MLVPMLQMVQTSNPDRAVPTRRISFEESLADLPKHFAGDGNVLASHIIAVLSSLFPDGRDFFVRSGAQLPRPDHRPGAQAPRSPASSGRESVHGREHRVLNDRLAELGYSTQFGEKVTFALMKFVDATAPRSGASPSPPPSSTSPPPSARLVLRDAERDTIGTSAVREVFEWHALEETEHKAVAFDVFRAVGGSEFRRRLGMRIVRPGFVVLVTVLVALSLLRDPSFWRPKNLKAAWGLQRTVAVLQADVAHAQGLRQAGLPP
ncbi:MAG: metal-dependent hydrolase [Acidimicrobiales bacterium]